ncbi:MAG TPA: MBL fold metallo-hydrolase [Solirubrobacteraceae bacterium]|nr:MBL fold metallo-hydrolase [Solirubrobacteraceae bacterium]
MPDAGGAHSGYLITHAGFTLLLECGSGVLSKLRQYADPARVDAVLISHLHADHMVDLVPFSFALSSGLLGSPRQPPLWAPPGGAASFAAYAAAVGMDDRINHGFWVREYDPRQELKLGPLRIRFCSVPHFVSCYACDLQEPTGRRLTFGADCGPNDGIVRLAMGTDLLMLEATEGTGPHVGTAPRGHLTAAEAGLIARHAQARRLLLTHYSDQLDAAELRRAAEQTYGGEVELAAEQARFTI